MSGTLTRRGFLASATTAVAAIAQTSTPEVIDLHQHTNYSGRSDEALVAHQRKMGISKTILLPAGARFGLAADAGRNDSCVELARKYPQEFYFFANEVPYYDEAIPTIEKYLKMGALGIGEQKFHIHADSRYIERLAGLAEEHNVPILMHFEHGAYNTGIERFHRILAKFPRVNFIGHAQTWWGNIDLNHDPRDLYSKTRVTPGGISDRLLVDYSNIYGDLSAGSGNNSLMRDEEHARSFLTRHQDKLIYGSDCNDSAGYGEACIGARTLEALRRLAPTPQILNKLLSGNARKLLRIA
ncbi:hypothetical protein BH24GEM2_BH24GEM2_13880 [soil metagenome]